MSQATLWTKCIVLIAWGFKQKQFPITPFLPLPD